MVNAESVAARFARLPDWLRRCLPAENVVLSRIQKLTGGAIQENWLLDLEVSGGPRAGAHRWVLRTGAPSALAVSHGRSEEFAILVAAHKAGVRVAEPIILCPDKGTIGESFLIVAWCPGTAQGRRIVRDPDLPTFGPSLARTLGSELAKLHRITPPRADLAFLGEAPVDAARMRIDRYRSELDHMDEAQPVIEHALNWLEDRLPKAGPIVLCHADYRTGNYLVHEGKLSAILDWEFAGWSEPNEDIGWFCARCWRFGQMALEAGGIASRDDFYEGYEIESKRSIDRAQIRFWEVMAHVRWSVIALEQEHRHLSGREPSLELALTGRMLPEILHDLMTEISSSGGRS